MEVEVVTAIPQLKLSESTVSDSLRSSGSSLQMGGNQSKVLTGRAELVRMVKAGLLTNIHAEAS